MALLCIFFHLIHSTVLTLFVLCIHFPYFIHSICLQIIYIFYQNSNYYSVKSLMFLSFLNGFFPLSFHIYLLWERVVSKWDFFENLPLYKGKQKGKWKKPKNREKKVQSPEKNLPLILFWPHFLTHRPIFLTFWDLSFKQT